MLSWASAATTTSGGPSSAARRRACSAASPRPAAWSSMPRTSSRRGESAHASTRSRSSAARTGLPPSTSSCTASSRNRSARSRTGSTADAHSRYRAARSPAPTSCSRCASSASSADSSASNPSAAATRWASASPPPSSPAAARCSSRRRVGERSSTTAARYSGWAKRSSASGPGRQVTTSAASRLSNAAVGSGTPAIAPTSVSLARARPAGPDHAGRAPGLGAGLAGGHDHRRGAVRPPLDRRGRPVRGLREHRRPAVALAPGRATSSALVNPLAGLSAWRAPPGAVGRGRPCCSAAPPSTASPTPTWWIQTVQSSAVSPVLWETGGLLTMIADRAAHASASPRPGWRRYGDRAGRRAYPAADGRLAWCRSSSATRSRTTPPC